VILGLHYPTDVAAGAALGGGLAAGSLLLAQPFLA
jgi:membrane-associated phospholipid phosphatase